MTTKDSIGRRAFLLKTAAPLAGAAVAWSGRHDGDSAAERGQHKPCYFMPDEWALLIAAADRLTAPQAGMLAANPDSVASVVLKGATTLHPASTSAQFTMRSFARRLSDQQNAGVTNFVRTNWGNEGGPVAAKAVASLRSYAQRQASR